MNSSYQIFTILLSFLYLLHYSNVSSESIPPPPVMVMNNSLLQTWYDPTQICMIEDNSHPNANYWGILGYCQIAMKQKYGNVSTQLIQTYPSGFLVLPSSAFSRKARDGCCNSDVKVHDRGYDWIIKGYENGTEQTQCIKLLELLSIHNKSILFMGDSMNNQVYASFLQECIREKIPGDFDYSCKDRTPWVQRPEEFGIGSRSIRYVSSIICFNFRSSAHQNSTITYNPVFIYVLDMWYGRREVADDRSLMEAVIPTICKFHSSGIILLPNIGHHLESERSRGHEIGMVTTISGFLNWMHLMSRLNGRKNLVIFRETTPSHFDSPDQDGSYEKWKESGRGNYDYMSNNSWDDATSVSRLYHCKSINTTIFGEKNTIENTFVRDILNAWGLENSRLKILHTYKYLAPFYRLKYGFCGGYDRIPTLDCVHFCGWSPAMWIPIWDELLHTVSDWLETSEKFIEIDNFVPNYEKIILEDVTLVRQSDKGIPGKEDMFLIYHGVKKFVPNLLSLEYEIGISRTSDKFPKIVPMTSYELAKYHSGMSLENCPDVKNNSAIRGDGNRVWYYKDNLRHFIPNWDTLCSLGFSAASIIPLADSCIRRINASDPVPAHDWPVIC